MLGHCDFDDVILEYFVLGLGFEHTVLKLCC